MWKLASKECERQEISVMSNTTDSIYFGFKKTLTSSANRANIK